MAEENNSKNKENKAVSSGKPAQEQAYLAAIRIRGQHDIRPEIEKGLINLNLLQKNSCSVHKDTPKMRGMLKKVKDYIAWGEIDKETLQSLIAKRGRKSSKDPKKTKKYFLLDSPKGGYAKNGIKKGFSLGGALGYRGSKVNDLLKKMI